MWLRSVLLICGVIAGTLADSPSDTVQISDDNLTRKNVAATTYQPPRSISIEEFVTSHKLPENVAKPLDDDDIDEYIDEKKVALKDNKQVAKKVTQKFENNEKKAASLEPARRLDLAEEDDSDNVSAKRQARVELENFSDTGNVLQEGRIKKIDSKRPRPSEQDEVIPGVYVSAEYPTTMLPILTTPREARSKDSLFDFVPVNIIREDSKNGYAHFSDANFGDLSDVSLVPAGTNSRIQVKKGPNGKDYEYEYVYYYYDEEDENKAGTAGSAVTNSYDIPSRTTSAPRRAGTANNRSKYSTVERSSTVEPSNNEVIPNRNGNRGRQLVETEDTSDERLPANTRFPPRSRSNHNTGTTESSRARSNRPRPNLDLVDSSSFRTHQEGPEFPQTLPKGPVRFLGVTPNEDHEEKSLTRNRGKPQRIQEPAPVEEVVDDTPTPRRRLSTTASSETGVELSRGQPIRFSAEDDDEEEDAAPERSGNKRVSSEDRAQESSETEASPIYPSNTPDPTDNPTTEYPAMDKVALDLYAFLQQGQSNLIDASSSEAGETAGDSTTLTDDEITTDLTTTAELTDSTTFNETTSSTTTTTTTTTTEPTTTTTTTTEPPTTTTQVPGRGKFRRPGIGGPAISRNRFKSNNGISTTEASAEPTQKTRARFGANGSNGGGFKRPRPGGNHKPIEEDTVQKETASSANAEKPAAGRGRFRAPSGGRIAISTTTSAPSNGATAPAAARPTFNKLNINNRRRGRPTTAAPGSEEPQEGATHSETGPIVQTPADNATPKSAVRTRLPGAPAIRPAIRPGGRVNLRQKPGQTTTTTPAPEAPEGSIEEPAGEGTEEETHEAPAETSPPARATTSNPLNKLRNRNRLQVQPKSTTKSPTLPPAIRRSPLLPRRKVTETPAVQSSQEETASAEETTAGPEIEPTEAVLAETSTAASTKHEETRGLSSLLAPRRRIAPRRPNQPVTRK